MTYQLEYLGSCLYIGIKFKVMSDSLRVFIYAIADIAGKTPIMQPIIKLTEYFIGKNELGIGINFPRSMVCG